MRPLPFVVAPPPAVSIGKGLQAQQMAALISSDPVRLTITAADPAKALLSLDGKTRGTPSVTVNANEFPRPNIFIQALADAGDVTLTYSGPGFAPFASVVRLFPATLVFNGAVLNMSRGGSYDVIVYAAALVAGQAEPGPGNLTPHTALTFSVVTSKPEVGSLKPTTLTITAGESRAAATFTATAAGSTTLTIQLPAGFVATQPPAQMVVVVN